MAKELRTRKGAILLWRLGNLEFGDQARWSRAPESKGMWAFPWPYWEWFLTHHQLRDLLPKRLQTMERRSFPRDLRWYSYPDGSRPTSVELDEHGWLADDELEVNPDFYREQEAWIETVGKRIHPIRKFWYDGDLYSHIDKRGGIGNPGTMGLGETDWFRMHSSEVAVAIRRARGDRYVERRSDKGLAVMKASNDHLELFIPARAGRITGFVDKE